MKNDMRRSTGTLYQQKTPSGKCAAVCVNAEGKNHLFNHEDLWYNGREILYGENRQKENRDMKKILSMTLSLALASSCLPAGLAEETGAYAVGDTESGFTVTRVDPYDLIGADVYTFVHDKTGAQVLLIKNEDDIKKWSSPHTKVKGETLLKILKTFAEHHDCKFIFVEKKQMGAKIIELLGGKNDNKRNDE